MTATVAERFARCFEGLRFDALARLYAEDAVFELHVGAEHEDRRGRDAILARYAADYDPPPTFLQWRARPAPWGGVVQGDALQWHGSRRVRYRWVHVLTVEAGLVVTDTVYCSGAVTYRPPPTAAGEEAAVSGSRPGRASAGTAPGPACSARP